MQAYDQKLSLVKGFEIIGKSSIGLMNQPLDDVLSAPEYAKNDLIEVTDVIIINNSSMVNFAMLKDAVRGYKHVFIADIPEFTPAQCFELQKLIEESGNIVHIRNPLMDMPATRWVVLNRKEPLYINYFESIDSKTDKRDFLVKLLLYAYVIHHAPPQKIRVSGIPAKEGAYTFLNIRLDFAAFSAMNFEILLQKKTEIKFKAVMPGTYLESENGKTMVNHKEFTLEEEVMPEFSEFIESVNGKTNKTALGFQALYKALVSYEELLGKLALYAPWF